KRWEAKRGLPIRRPPGATKATVYAEVAELEHWLRRADSTGEEEAAIPGRPAARRRRYWAVGTSAVLLLAAVGTGLALQGGVVSAAARHHQPDQAVADLYFSGR